MSPLYSEKSRELVLDTVPLKNQDLAPEKRKIPESTTTPFVDFPD